MKFNYPQLMCRLKDYAFYSNIEDAGRAPVFMRTTPNMLIDPNIDYSITENPQLYHLFIEDDEISKTLRRSVELESIKKTKRGKQESQKLISKWYEIKPMKMASKTNKEAKQAVHDFICNGFAIDDTLLTVFMNDVLCVLPTINPELFMPYQDHIILFTNSSTGKSHIANRTGKLSTSISSKHLKGFSSAQKIDTHYGAANNLTLPLTFDELQEQPEQIETLKGIMTLLDLGKDQTMVGHGTPPVKAYFRLRIQGNPHVEFGELSDDKLVMEFQSFMKKITSNYRAAMRRFALLIFDDNLKETHGKPIKTDEFIKLRNEFNAIRELCAPHFTKFYQTDEVIKFLNEKHDKKYIERLEEISSKLSGYSNYEKELVSGMRLNFRRVRGMAFKLALCDNLKTLSEGKLTANVAIKDAQKYYKLLVELQLKNMQNIIRIEVETDMFGEILRQKYEALTKFEKALLKTLEKIEKFEDWIVLETLDISQNYTGSGSVSTPIIIKKLIGINKDIQNLNERLNPFGVTVGYKRDNLVVKVDQKILNMVVQSEII